MTDVEITDKEGMPTGGDVLDEEEGPTEPSPSPMLYGSVEEFVADFLAVIYERPLPNGQRTWCPKWWMHDEAVYRFQALWHAWEFMRVHDGMVGSASWLVQYADPIMAVIFDSEGPFKRCTTTDGHRDKDPHPDARLPCDPAPPGLWEPREE